MSGINGVLVIDKPRDFTSHDVVAVVRGIAGTRKAGHGGTLDPLATGVLPIFLGKATKAVDIAASSDKEYIALMKLGLCSDTQDITGNVTVKAADLPDAGRVARALLHFTGELMQTPPMYSAVKKNGKKLYELARRGIETEREPRRICVRELELLESDESAGEYSIRILCSKGTYVRTLCHDIGESLGCGALMAGLRRTRAGMFRLEQSVSLERLKTDGAKSHLMPLDALFAEYPALILDERQERQCRNGADITGLYPDQSGGGDLTAGNSGRVFRIYSNNGQFLSLSKLSEKGESVLVLIKNFF